MTLNQRITAARNHLARAASYIAESLGTDSLHDTEQFPTEMCWCGKPKIVDYTASGTPIGHYHVEDDDPITTDYELRATNPKGHSE